VPNIIKLKIIIVAGFAALAMVALESYKYGVPYLLAYVASIPLILLFAIFAWKLVIRDMESKRYKTLT